MTQNELKEILRYDPDTGIFIWKLNVGKRLKAGQRAGSNDGRGYIHIKINGKNYKAHRLAWLYMYGQWPKKHIDHINKVKHDNRIENLRCVTNQENLFNTDAKGYSWHKASQKWKAKIVLDGKHKHLGLYDTEAEARTAYIKAKDTMHIVIGENNDSRSEGQISN